jgi:hypothetical protein
MKNFKRVPILTMAMLTVVLVAAPALCPAASPGAMPPASAEGLQNYIVSEDPYTDWELWPGTTELHKGSQPHGAFLTTFVNDIALHSLEEGSKEFTPGSIIVKENFSGSKKLVHVAVMYKAAGYNPDGGDWYWLKYAPDGSVDAEGKVSSCIGCHRLKQDQDWVFTEIP